MSVAVQLMRARTFALAASVSLALAVGANSAIFSIVNALWLRPLPVRDAERVVVPYYPVVYSPDGELLDDVRLPQAEALAGLTAFEGVTYELSSANRLGDWRPIVRLEPSGRTIKATAVPDSYFEVLGVPVRGRSFSSADEQFGAAHVAVISERLRRQLALPDVPNGVVLRTSRGDITIIGVAPSDFHGPRIGDQIDLWMPFLALGAFSDLGLDPRIRILTPVVVFARLRPDVSITAAQDEVRGVLDHRTTLRSLRDVAFPLRSEGALVRQSTLVRTLWVSAVLVLVLGAANLAALLTARAVTQRHHWAVRLSVGATPVQLVRMVLVEVAIIAASGLGLGLLFRYWLLKSIALLEPAAGVPIDRLDVSLDGRVLVFALAVVLISAALSSSGAVRLAAQSGLSTLLAAGASTGTRRKALGRQLLLAAHTALAVTLLTASAGLISTVRRAVTYDMGFDRDQVVFARVRPALAQYMNEADDGPRRVRDYRETLARLAVQPGIEGVGYGSALIESEPPRQDAVALTVDGVARQVRLNRLEAGPGFLRAAGAVFIDGRDFEETDAREAVTPHEMMRFLMLRRVGRAFGAPPKNGRSAAVIDSTLAAALWPGQSAIGRAFQWNSLQITYEVVGLVRPLGMALSGGSKGATLVAPLALESQDGARSFDLLVRSRRHTDSVVASVTGTLRELFPDAPVLEVKSATQVLNSKIAQERMGARIFTWYAAAAVALGLVGVHGLLAFFADQIRRDLAIRAALGATASGLAWIAAVRVLAPITCGVLLGLLLSSSLGRILGASVIGLSTPGVLAQAAAASIFLVACGAVTVAGTRKVWRIDPVEVLRTN